MTDQLAVVYRRTAKLKPHPANSRKHSKAQIAQIAESIKAFGFTNPILVDENDVILAGHGRWAGAKAARLVDVPVIPLRGLTDEQKRTYIIADNRIAEGSEWDKDKLMSEVESLMGNGVSLDFLDLGKLDSDLAEMIGDRDDSETPEDARDRREGEKAKKARKVKHEEQEDEGGDPSKDRNSINFPLYVVLTPVQHKKWRELRGKMSDKQAMACLLANPEAVAAILALEAAHEY